MIALPKFYSLKVFTIKLKSWEYWPFWVIYFPVGVYYFWLSIKSKSFGFFNASNPSIFSGGMLFESKMSIFNIMPKNLFPATIYIADKENFISINNKLKENNIKYPLIAKPDRGCRGWGVSVIKNEEELKTYQQKINNEFIIQNLINYPLEYSVFYERKPTEKYGKVTGVTRKELLNIIGDGNSTILQLILNYERAFLQLQTLQTNTNIDFNKILNKGERYELVPIGNHVRGAMFINDSHIINEQLHQTFDAISKQINDFYFGRFDLKCTSEADLIEGKNIMIVELNGAGAEPSHIYDPNFSFIKAQKVLCKYFNSMYQIAKYNHKNGVPYMSLKTLLKTSEDEKKYQYKATF